MGATKAATTNTAMTEEGERTERQKAPTGEKKGGQTKRAKPPNNKNSTEENWTKPERRKGTRKTMY
eukprot:scaffold3687_cov66-Cylindrotheca_fusiformis.AAC.2